MKLRLKIRSMAVLSLLCLLLALAGCAGGRGDRNSVDNGKESGRVDHHGSGKPQEQKTSAPDGRDTEKHPKNLSENEKAHEAYQKYLQEDGENRPSKYAYYDVDGDGVDELIGSGYFATEVHAFAEGKIKDVHYQKYGGDFKIYPGKGIIYFPHGGHMDHYYKQYVRLAGGKSDIAAVVEWKNEFVKDPKHQGEYKSVCVERTYKVNGKSAGKKEYQAFRDSLKGEKAVTQRDVQWKRVVTQGEKRQLQSLVANRKDWQFPAEDALADTERYAYMVSDLDDDGKIELVLCLSWVGTGFYSDYSVQEVTGEGKLKRLEFGGRKPTSCADIAASDISVYEDEEGYYHYAIDDWLKNGGMETWDTTHDFSIRGDKIYDRQICGVRYYSKDGESGDGDHFNHISYYRGESEKITKKAYKQAKKKYYANMEKQGTISFAFDYDRAMKKEAWESLSDEELLSCLEESWKNWN